jgi:hypothetical protein
LIYFSARFILASLADFVAAAGVAGAAGVACGAAPAGGTIDAHAAMSLDFTNTFCVMSFISLNDAGFVVLTVSPAIANPHKTKRDIDESITFFIRSPSLYI